MVELAKVLQELEERRGNDKVARRLGRGVARAVLVVRLEEDLVGKVAHVLLAQRLVVDNVLVARERHRLLVLLDPRHHLQQDRLHDALVGRCALGHAQLHGVETA